MTSRGFFLRLAIAGALASGLTTAAWAFDLGGEGGEGSNSCCCCSKPGMYHTPSGKVMNVHPARKATGGKKKAATPARPKAKTSPKPRKKVNFTTKRK